MRATVEQLLDTTEIIDLQNRHSYVLDSRDWDELATFYAPNATGEFHGRGLVEGYEEMRAIYSSALDELSELQHLLTNQVVDLDGDLATVKAYFYGYHRASGVIDGETYVMGGTYIDTFRRTDGRWLLEHHVIAYNWTEGNSKLLYWAPL